MATKGNVNQNGSQRIGDTALLPPVGTLEAPNIHGTVPECVVFETELDEIVKRRMAIHAIESEDRRKADKANLSGDKSASDAIERLAFQRDAIGNDLVGLSLSGGGVRSASFNIGLLQAFGSTGFIKYVDYLSTVSGGGYAGAVFSSQSLAAPDSEEDLLWARLHPFARQGECRYEAQSCPRPLEACSLRVSSLERTNGREPRCNRRASKRSGNRDDGQQNPLMQRLAYGGNYLFRSTAEFVSRYLIGLLLNNLVLLSGVVSVCAFVAWLWRWLDHPWFYEHVLLPLESRIPLPGDWRWDAETIRPFLPLAVLLPLWIVSWAAARRVSPLFAANLHRGMFAAVIAAALIGVAVRLGNRDVGGSDSFWDWQNSFYPWLGLAGSLLPFIRPKLLIDSAVRPKNQMQSYAFFAASTILLVGGPLFGVFWFAREDFAQTSEHRSKITSNDFILPERLLKAVCPTSSFLPLSDDARAEVVNRLHNLSSVRHLDQPQRHWRITSKQLLSSEATTVASQAAAVRLQAVADVAEGRFRATIGRRITEAWLARHRADERADPQVKGEKKQVTELFTDLDDANRTKELKWLSDSLVPLIDASADEPMPLDLANDVPTDPGTFLQVAKLRAARQMQFEWLELDESRRERFQRYYEDRFVTIEEPQLRELLSRYQRHGVAKPTSSMIQLGAASDLRLTRQEAARLNRLLLNAWYPAYFHTRAFISTHIVVIPDQKARFRWFIGAAGLCLLTAFFLDPNRTSIQGYYRDRITENFVLPTKDDGRDIRLAHLSTCAGGAPYHLVSGTATLKTLRSAIGLREPDAAHDLEIFLFSKLFCGSRTLHYAPTGAYLPAGCDTLGNAVSVSGAAVSPDAINNLLLRAMMTILNLRQGQWLPNPSEARRTQDDGRHTYWRPNYLWLLLGLWKPIRRQRICFVTDGGHRENLGLVQLLMRRCRLIIASDAGCDPAHNFDDLARALRICDMHLGVRFEEIPAPVRKSLPCGTSQSNGSARQDLQSEPLDLYSVKRTVTDDVNGRIGRPEVHSERLRQENLLVERHFLLARIVYPDGPDGLLVYLKPSLDGDESEAIENYRAQNCDFPHESTSDQDYHPAQFMSYVMLGHHIGDTVANLFSPAKVQACNVASNWWQIPAGTVNSLVRPYLSPEAPTAEQKPCEADVSVSTRTNLDYEKLLDDIRDTTRDIEVRLDAVGKLQDALVGHDGDTDAVKKLRFGIGSLVVELVAQCKQENDDAMQLLRRLCAGGGASTERVSAAAAK